MLRALNRPVVALAAVAVLAGGLRFYNLDFPPNRIFDEIYYSKSACIYVGYSEDRCGVRSNDEHYWVQTEGETGSWVHPPLGKWAIGAGEGSFGTGSFGWRVSAALFGTLSVVAIAAIAQLLFTSPLWTFVAGLLLATEGLNFVQSRTSMLDIFLAFWVALGFLFLALDRRRIERRTPAPPEPEPTEAAAGEAAVEETSPPLPVPSPILRPWRLAAGVALGAAFATKWSGLTAILGAVLVSYLWERTRRKRAGVHHPIRRAIVRESFGIAVALLVVPALVYLASYTGWFVKFGFHPSAWWSLQRRIFDYHFHLRTIDASGKPVHPYLSQAWKWILLWRPVLYYAKYPTESVRRVIYANGNPAIFWGSLIAIPYLAYAWRRKRDWRPGFVLVAILALYVPWFLVARPQFFFYMTPITPFLALADTYLVKDLSEAHVAGSRSRPYLPVAVGFIVVSVALFAFFWPVLTGSPVSTTAWQLRTWFKSWV